MRIVDSGFAKRTKMVVMDSRSPKSKFSFPDDVSMMKLAMLSR
jgi:hypothetical protein